MRVSAGRLKLSILAAAITAHFCAGAVALALANPKVGSVASEFKATTFDGHIVSLSDFKGQVLILNIWATWCGPCKKELPLLDAYFAAMSKYGLRAIAITTEDSLPANRLKPLQGILRIPLARRFRGRYEAIGGAVPTNFVIDRKGVIRYAAAGAFDLDTLNEVLVPLLNEPAPSENTTMTVGSPVLGQ